MQTVVPFQVERISFFENDSKAQVEVKILDGALSYPSEIIISINKLNRIINALNEFSSEILDRLTSNIVPGEGKYFELDLRADDMKPVIELADVEEPSFVKRIRA